MATVALALAIPLTLHSGADFPERGRLVLIAFSVVLFTLLVRGLSLPWLARRLQLDIDQDRHEQAVRQLWWRAAKAVLTRLGELDEQDKLPAEVADRLRDRQHDRLARLCPENYAEEDTAEAKLRLAQFAGRPGRRAGDGRRLPARAARRPQRTRGRPGTGRPGAARAGPAHGTEVTGSPRAGRNVRDRLRGCIG